MSVEGLAGRWRLKRFPGVWETDVLVALAKQTRARSRTKKEGRRKKAMLVKDSGEVQMEECRGLCTVIRQSDQAPKDWYCFELKVGSSAESALKGPTVRKSQGQWEVSVDERDVFALKSVDSVMFTCKSFTPTSVIAYHATSRINTIKQ